MPRIKKADREPEVAALIQEHDSVDEATEAANAAPNANRERD